MFARKMGGGEGEGEREETLPQIQTLILFDAVHDDEMNLCQ